MVTCEANCCEARLTRGSPVALFICTDKDPHAKQVRVENAFRALDGRCFLLLHRLPPVYAKPPTFLVELSKDVIEIRGVNGEAPIYYKAYAHQSLNVSEKQMLLNCKPGKTILPFFNFSYPNVIAVLGKQFQCLPEAETRAVVQSRTWKLIGEKH